MDVRRRRANTVFLLGLTTILAGCGLATDSNSGAAAQKEAAVKLLNGLEPKLSSRGKKILEEYEESRAKEEPKG